MLVVSAGIAASQHFTLAAAGWLLQLDTSEPDGRIMKLTGNLPTWLQILPPAAGWPVSLVLKVGLGTPVALYPLCARVASIREKACAVLEYPSCLKS
jgi:hypothetical protein